jgi:ATP-dependent helicase/nuclease subunit B
MALRAGTTRMGEGLRYFRHVAQTAGFFTQLERLVEELLSEAVSPESLGEAAGALDSPAARRKIAELSAIYQGYLDWLGRERLDPAARLSLLRARLAGRTWLRDSLFWVDGFAGFTGLELATIVELARAARGLTLTLLLDPDSPVIRANAAPGMFDLFGEPKLTYQKLKTLSSRPASPAPTRSSCTPRRCRVLPRPLSLHGSKPAWPHRSRHRPAPRPQAQRHPIRLFH